MQNADVTVIAPPSTLLKNGLFLHRTVSMYITLKTGCNVENVSERVGRKYKVTLDDQHDNQPRQQRAAWSPLAGSNSWAWGLHSKRLKSENAWCR